MNKLTKRLDTIAKIVSGETVCDVGCDHGKLADYLLENNIVKYIYVSDISMPSLKKAIDLLTPKYDNFQAICTNGLKDYKSDMHIDECIISGMGGYEIVEIIKNSPIQIDSYILSPQQNIIETKKFMLDIGYNIVFDIIIKDKDKFYTIFKCQKTNRKVHFSDYELMFGRDNFSPINHDFVDYVNYESHKTKKIIDRIEDESKKKEFVEKLKFFDQAKKELKEYE